MLQANAAMSRGTASAVRWLVRALLLIAGIAAAWLIGDATASAAQLAPAPAAEAQPNGDEATPVTDRVMAATDDLTWGVSDLVGDTTATALRYGTAGGPAIPARGAEAAADLRQTVHTFTRDAVLHPVARTLGTAEHISRKPQDASQVIGQALTPTPAFQGFRAKVWGFLHPNGAGLIKLPGLRGASAHNESVVPTAAQALPVFAAPPVVGPVAVTAPDGPTAQTVPAVQHDDGTGRTHGDERDQFPYSPLHGPLAPAGVPMAPGGVATGGHLDGLLFGVPAGGPAVHGVDDRSAVRIVSRHTPVQPGEQPGVTPD